MEKDVHFVRKRRSPGFMTIITWVLTAVMAVGATMPAMTAFAQTTSSPTRTTFPQAYGQDLALGKPYTINTQYPDSFFMNTQNNFPNNGQLTNGQYGSLGFNDGAWVGFYRQYNRTITINLGSQQNLQAISLDFLQDTPDGITFPGHVTYQVSQDGSSWTTVGTVADSVGTWSTAAPVTQAYELSGLNINAKYVQATFNVPIWGFVDQFNVFGGPTPSTTGTTPVGQVTPAIIAPGYLQAGSTQAGGIRNLLLAYADGNGSLGQWSESDFMPMLQAPAAHLSGTNRLFDGVLFLSYSPFSTASQWSGFVQNLFTPGTQLSALDQAAAVTGSTPEKVVITIPGLDNNPSNFGSITPGGPNLDMNPVDVGQLTAYRNKLQAIQWYINQVMAAWKQAGFQHLKLVGFYWSPETLNSTLEYKHAIVQQTAQMVHAQNLLFYWIPFYGAYGITEWKKLGFDAVMVQPNVSFTWAIDPHSRFTDIATLAQDEGLGVEMELYWGALYTTNMNVAQISQDKWDDYFTAGNVFGYQHNALLSYYDSSKNLTSLAENSALYYNQIFQNTVQFIENGWNRTSFANPVASTIGGLQYAQTDVSGQTGSTAFTDVATQPTVRDNYGQFIANLGRYTISGPSGYQGVTVDSTPYSSLNSNAGDVTIAPNATVGQYTITYQQDAVSESSNIDIGSVTLSASPNSVGQTVTGSVYNSTVTATVYNGWNQPVANAPINFLTSSGTLSTTSAVTDSNGIATVQVNMDSSTHFPVTVSASVNGLVGSTTVTSGSAPAAPTGLMNANMTTTGWKESWTPVMGAQSYNVYLNGSLIDTVTGAVYTFAGIAPNTTNTVKVEAAANGLTSSLSSPDSIVLPSQTPANLVVTAVNGSFQALTPGQTISFNATVTDSYGMPVAGANVALQPSLGALALGQQTQPTSGAGTISAAFTAPSSAGSGQISANVSFGGSNNLFMIPFTVIPGASTHATFTMTPQVVVSGKSVTVSGTVYDANQNPVPDTTLTLSSPVGGFGSIASAALPRLTVTTDTYGSYQTIWQALNATVGTVTVTGSVYGQNVGFGTISVYDPLNFTSSQPPTATLGTAYTDPLQATGGYGALTWSVASGVLPSGLTLDSTTGVISGTPTAAGSSNVSIQVEDAVGNKITHALTITVQLMPSITTAASLPSAMVSSNYSQTLNVSGGLSPYTWSVSSGTLPAGLTLNSVTGVISGTPEMTGVSKFIVQVQDSIGTKIMQALTITIYPAPIYTQPTTTPSSPSSTGTGSTPMNSNFSAVLTRITATAQGQTVNLDTADSTLAVNIPGGALTAGETVNVTTASIASLHNTLPTGDTGIAAFGVQFAGASPATPVSITLKNQDIARGALAFKEAPDGTLTPVPAVIKHGVAVVSLTANADVFIVNPTLATNARQILWNGAQLQVSHGYVFNHTTYLPIWYVMQLLKEKAGITSTWNGIIWNLTTSAPPNLSSITPGTGKMQITINGTLVQNVEGQYGIDPLHNNKTTYMPIYWIAQVLQRVGIDSSWNGVSWDLSAPSSANSASQ